MNNFDEIKAIVLKSAKENGACSGEYKKALESSDLSELCAVLKENFNWGCNNGVITTELLEKFKDGFAECEIFVNQNVTTGYMLASGSATVRAFGSATVRASVQQRLRLSVQHILLAVL